MCDFEWLTNSPTLVRKEKLRPQVLRHVCEKLLLPHLFKPRVATGWSQVEGSHDWETISCFLRADQHSPTRQNRDFSECVSDCDLRFDGKGERQGERRRRKELILLERLWPGRIPLLLRGLEVIIDLEKTTYYSPITSLLTCCCSTRCGRRLAHQGKLGGTQLGTCNVKRSFWVMCRRVVQVRVVPWVPLAWWILRHSPLEIYGSLILVRYCFVLRHTGLHQCWSAL